MKYVGSKSRIARHIAPVIQGYIDVNKIETYLEPFVGGANIIDKIWCKNRIGNDINKYLIALLKELGERGDILPDDVTEEEYNLVKNNKDNYPDWYVGFMGFCIAYRSCWFTGYAGTIKEKKATKKDNRNYAKEAIINLKNQIPDLEGIKFTHGDYEKYSEIRDAVVYCDPPYEDTRKYMDGKLSFDSERFWRWCLSLDKSNIVIVSEYKAPEGFKCIWEQDLKISVANEAYQRIEKLFIRTDK